MKEYLENAAIFVMFAVVGYQLGMFLADLWLN